VDPSNESLALLERMHLVRAFEEKVAEVYAAGRVTGLIHLGIDQEAVAVGVSSLLRPGDTVFGGHRSHGHALAMGADPERTLAEIAGRASGYGKGKGGSMHLVAADAGFVTATGVVAGNIPLALGGALAARTTGSGAVAVAGLGAEVAALIQAGGFDALAAPVERVGAPFAPVPASPDLERLYVPDAAAIADAAGRTIGHVRVNAQEDR